MTDAHPESARVFAYHARTKHSLQAYARSLGWLDWATQPDPFRTYDGAASLELPLVADDLPTLYRELYAPGAVAPRALDHGTLGAFFELALGITAWKELGPSRWALRSDPSSGNLHPTEAYALLPALGDAPAGLWHYVSRDHRLELRARLARDDTDALAEHLPAGGFLVGVSSIWWREAWKYGERAFRYCQHDAGHVLATLRFAAASVGLGARLLDGLGTDEVGALLGLDRAADFAHLAREEGEHAEYVLAVAPPAALAEAGDDGLAERAVRAAALVRRGAWSGRPNALSRGHVAWNVIDDVAAATVKPPTERGASPQSAAGALEESSESRSARHASAIPACRDERPKAGASTPGGASEVRNDSAEASIVARQDARRSGPAHGPPDAARAATLIRQRRSAVALDGRTTLSEPAFYGMLDRILPRPAVAPWDALPWPPRLHLGLFVHRVDGLAPGLYLLERTADVHETFVALLGTRPLWKRPPRSPAHLRLFCIAETDCRRAAEVVSCHQKIAADGAFSLGMLADFRAPLEREPWTYRRLFWEAGVLGQVLYLEAEAAGVRSTGIGCYFDDAFHEVLGLEDDRFQSLYHFTVGGPVDDPRITTLPAYERG